MVERELAATVAELPTMSRSAFEEAAAAEGEALREAIEDGVFDNSEGLVGLEYEFYAVRGADPDATGGAQHIEQSGSLCRVPRRTLSFMGFEKELGLHNAEMSTMPQPHNQYGLAAQGAEVRARLAAAQTAITPYDMRLVSDGVWTIPPVGETAVEYLGDSVETDGVTLATNMSESLRYHAFANLQEDLYMRVDLPHATFEADTIMPESLITSIQPHYQVPRAAALAEYFRYAIRLAGPLLALGVNSPLLPPSLYDEGVPTDAILEDAYHEQRIGIFEESVNGPDLEKVRFPADVETTGEAIERIVADRTLVPMEVESKGRFDDEFAHFRHKHGTYWRWIRPVFGGASRSSANARIEFRALPGQPTVQDAIALQACFAGALEGFHGSGHPIRTLPWEVAKENFYAAMRDGLDADLTWITADGRETTDTGALFTDLLDYVEQGLNAQLHSNVQVSEYLDPLVHRMESGTTPAAWQLACARTVADRGADLETTIHEAKRAYLELQDDTLLEGAFSDWPDPEVAVADA